MFNGSNPPPLTPAALLAAHADVHAVDKQQGATALHAAAASNNTRMLKLVLGAGGARLDNPDAGGRLPIHYAAAAGSWAALQTLAEAGGGLDAQVSLELSPNAELDCLHSHTNSIHLPHPGFCRYQTT